MFYQGKLLPLFLDYLFKDVCMINSSRDGFKVSPSEQKVSRLTAPRKCYASFQSRQQACLPLIIPAFSGLWGSTALAAVHISL